MLFDQSMKYIISALVLPSLKGIVLTIFLTGVVRAEPSEIGTDLIYGPEWTFTASDIGKGLNESKYLKKILDQLLSENKKHKKFKSIGADFDDPSSPISHDNKLYDITLTTLDGVRIAITTDPGVLEVQVSPLSLKQWKKKSKFFQEYIFDVMKNAGLAPHEREGAGHINIGLGYFESKPELVERFIIDYLNNPGVGVVLNSLSANFGDAPSIEQYLKQQEYTPADIQEFSSEAHNMRILPISTFKNNYYKWSSLFKYLNEKYTAIGLRDYSYMTERLLRTTRLEMRQLRPQQSMSDYIKALEIFEARIKYLEKQRGLPPLNIQSITDGWVFLGQFANYLEEAGLDVKNFKSLMPEAWRELPFSNYIRTKPIWNANKCAKVHL